MTSVVRPKGRRLDPVEAFEVTPWRALALFRITTVIYAIVLTVHNAGRHQYAYPDAAFAVSAVMVVWTAMSITGYERPRLRAWPLLITDVAVTAACVLVTRPVVGLDVLSRGVPGLAVTWLACPVLAVAVVKGIPWGIMAAVFVGGCDIVAKGLLTQSSLTGMVIMVMAAAAVGYLGNIATSAQEQLRYAAAFEAAHGERDRLARGIHDSVLQVLALVQRRGEQLGGEAAELGRLAGEQEVALRSLVSQSDAAGATAGVADLRDLVSALASARMTVSTPATPVWLPAQVAREMMAAVAAATENVHQHCAAGTRVWLLLEEEREQVTVTVRDDGPGIAPGRLDEAAAQGRLGVAQSIRGRIADIGGRVTITTAPGQGTQIELTVQR